jgi:hypothetical protein
LRQAADGRENDHRGDDPGVAAKVHAPPHCPDLEVTVRPTLQPRTITAAATPVIPFVIGGNGTKMIPRAAVEEELSTTSRTSSTESTHPTPTPSSAPRTHARPSEPFVVAPATAPKTSPPAPRNHATPRSCTICVTAPSLEDSSHQIYTPLAATATDGVASYIEPEPRRD